MFDCNNNGWNFTYSTCDLFKRNNNSVGIVCLN